MPGSHGTAGTVIFLHIPKAAGSTLTTIIQKQYQPEEVQLTHALAGPGSPGAGLPAQEKARFRYAQVQAMPAAARQQIKVLLGHDGFGFHQLFDPPVTYVTLLRDPVERVISHYFYARSHRRNRLYDTVVSQRMSLAEFVASGLSLEVDNGQTKYLAGLGTPYLKYGTYGDEILEQAKHNLAQWFAVVGLTEQFDASLILLKRTLGWRMPFYAKVNVTRNRPGREAISAAVIEQIKAYNRLDLELYAFARQLFNAQVAQQGPDFARELKRFERLNGVYGRLHYAYGVVRRWTRLPLRPQKRATEVTETRSMTQS